MDKTKTTDNSVKNGRNPDGTFAIGNPGKPKGAKHMTTKFYEALEKLTDDGKKTYSDLLVKRILNDAIVKGSPEMIKLLVHYIDGMPQQGIDITTDGERLDSGADVLEIARRVSQELKKSKTKK